VWVGERQRQGDWGGGRGWPEDRQCEPWCQVCVKKAGRTRKTPRSSRVQRKSGHPSAAQRSAALRCTALVRWFPSCRHACGTHYEGRPRGVVPVRGGPLGLSPAGPSGAASSGPRPPPARQRQRTLRTQRRGGAGGVGGGGGRLRGGQVPQGWQDTGGGEGQVKRRSDAAGMMRHIAYVGSAAGRLHAAGAGGRVKHSTGCEEKQNRVCAKHTAARNTHAVCSGSLCPWRWRCCAAVRSSSTHCCSTSSRAKHACRHSMATRLSAPPRSTASSSCAGRGGS
jgi:hypothetical protein